MTSLIRSAVLSHAGEGDLQTAMAGIVPAGSTVLLKPNWVLHYNQSGHTMDCMITHPVFIEAVLDMVLAANPGRVLIGDAPIQLCQFDAAVAPAWRAGLAAKASVPVEFVDFRRCCATGPGLSDGVLENVRSQDRYAMFDLGPDSLLEPVSGRTPRFRVTNYNPTALARTHRRGKHQYLLCKEAFEADVIIGLPKLKTHRKAGITGALKNLVGLNGNKDYLPHHRLGGTALGGDCYRGLAPLKRAAEFCLDQANRRINTPDYEKWRGRSCRILNWHRRWGDGEIEGSWHGNDTTWRMVLDLNRILMYGRADGVLADTPQRRICTITDAIVAGQGEGPLAPEPLDLGVVTFTASSACADLVHAGLMGLDYRRLPVVREAFSRFRYPLTDCTPEQCVIRVGNTEMDWSRAAGQFGRPARPPRGWAGHVELPAGRSRPTKGSL